MPLTPADPHHWAPIPAVVEWLTNRLAPDARVLEIGPGHAPFFRADTFVDFAPWPIAGVAPEKLIKCDLANEPLPFADKSFDFIYCRHTLEDMYNPFSLCKEMERVGKSGYIETPSPIAELTRGVDGGAPPYRGYHHHRFIIWASGDDLCFVSKYPIVEYGGIDDERFANRLRQGPRYWNTYYLWQNRIHVRHLQSPLDYDIPRGYGGLLLGAVEHSVAATDAFYSRLPAPQVAPNLLKSA
jgi:SAM-dependent methyltransferase